MILRSVMLNQYTPWVSFDLRIDRDLTVPVTAQLRGQLEYGIAFGDLAPGVRLPSVRDLAYQLGIAPVTVSQVYRELQDNGLLETRVGRGTFVRRDAPRPARPDHHSHALDDLIHRLAWTAREIGLAPGELAEIIAVRLGRLEQGTTLHAVFVGNFADATRRYVHAIQRYLRPGDRLDAVILTELQKTPAALAKAVDADVVLTLAYREAELRALLGPDAQLVTIPFLPSADTRRRLADLDRAHRVGLVSTYADYLVTFRRVVETYAPHIDVYRAAIQDGEDLPDLLDSCDVVIYGTGSEQILTHLPATADAFEFQFEPDSRALLSTALPALDAIREGRSMTSVSLAERTPQP